MLAESGDEHPTQQGDAFIGTDDYASIHATMTTKVPPAYDGRTSWFAYEELIDELSNLNCDINNYKSLSAKIKKI